MTKAELIAEINTNYGPLLEEKHMNPNDPASYGKWYQLLLQVVKNQASFHQVVHIIVYDEGGPTEEAYYKDGMPEDQVDYDNTTTAFREAVETSIQNKVDTGVIEKGSIREIDEEKKKAVVEIYMMDTGTLYNRLYLVWEDNTQTMQFEKIVQE